VSRTAQTGFVLDALEQARDARCIAAVSCIIATGAASFGSTGHRNTTLSCLQRGVESLSRRLPAQRLAWPCVEAGSHRRGPWRSLEAVEFATLEWVDWFNNRRLLEPIGNIPPAEAEALYYAAQDSRLLAA
jgi:transposase InsO family protein